MGFFLSGNSMESTWLLSGSPSVPETVSGDETKRRRRLVCLKGFSHDFCEGRTLSLIHI